MKGFNQSCRLLADEDLQVYRIRISTNCVKLIFWKDHLSTLGDNQTAFLDGLKVER